MTASDQGAILALLRAQEDAIAKGDAAAAVAPMAADIVSYELPPPLVMRGAGAGAVEGLKEWFATWQDGVSVEMRDPEILVDGDLAVAFGLSRMRGIKKGEGPLDQWSRRTLVLRRVDGAWRIVHEHASFPMRMDGSGVAATDLQP